MATPSRHTAPPLTFPPPNSAGQAYCQIDEDGSRYLLGDYLGGLHLLVLACVDGAVVGLKLQPLGTTSAASALAYLDSGVAFVGSRSGDHQLIRLHSEPVGGAAPAGEAAAAGGAGGGGSTAAGAATPAAASGAALASVSAAAAAPGAGDDGAALLAPGGGEEGAGAAPPPCYVEVLDSFTSLAPILDFAVQDMDRAGQGQLVMACGTLRDGSLRVVRNGIGLNELNCVELAGIRGVWALRPGWRDAHDRLLVLTFVGETRVRRALRGWPGCFRRGLWVRRSRARGGPAWRPKKQNPNSRSYPGILTDPQLLAIDEDDELGEVELEGFDSGRQTLLCSNTAHDTLLQVHTCLGGQWFGQLLCCSRVLHASTGCIHPVTRRLTQPKPFNARSPRQAHASSTPPGPGCWPSGRHRPEPPSTSPPPAQPSCLCPRAAAA
jgi:hypothetical protein